MSGRVISVLPRTEFDYSELSANAERVDVVARRIDLDGWADLQYAVRIWRATVASGASLTAQLRSVSATPEDPGVVYATGGFDFHSITIPTTPSPVLRTDDVGESAFTFGPGVRLAVVAAQASSPGTLTCTISIDLLVRDGVQSRLSGGGLAWPG